MPPGLCKQCAQKPLLAPHREGSGPPLHITLFLHVKLAHKGPQVAKLLPQAHGTGWSVDPQWQGDSGEPMRSRDSGTKQSQSLDPDMVRSRACAFASSQVLGRQSEMMFECSTLPDTVSADLVGAISDS